MKNRCIAATLFLMAFLMAATPALAGYYGYRHYRRPHYPRHHHSYHHHYHGGDVFLGAMLGLTLGAILIPPPPPPVHVYREYPPTVIYRERHVYVPAPGRIETRPVYAAEARPSGDPNCLQTREYTTRITIEGKEVEAYGTKCLRPDGSWSYGPAQPVPDFQ